jgi:hypothetical protein
MTTLALAIALLTQQSIDPDADALLSEVVAGADAN